MRKEYLKNIKRIVVKVGTKSLINKKNNLLDKNKIKKLSYELINLHKQGKEVILVSSGAIILGSGIMGLKKRPESIPEKQAAASVGQISLMNTYKKFFEKANIEIGQILLTEEDLKNRKKYLNARNTFITLIERFKIIPIVNENDVVGIEEIVFGDNDILASLVANLVDADILIFLTDTDGFAIFQNNSRVIVNDVPKITKEIEKYADKSGSDTGKGGMISKIKAAKISTCAGIPAVIVNSNEKNILKRVITGEEVGTFFYPNKKVLSHKKRWIAYSVAPKGEIFIDDGAKNAIVVNGKSLLPGGIIKIKGEFSPGDPVDILDKNNNLIGRGLVNYSNTIVEKIMGKRSDKIKSFVGEKYYDEVIHRDNLVIYQ